MNTNEVLIDLLEDNRRRLKRLCEGMVEACFRYKPDLGANNIAVTLWHMGRLFDHFFHTQGLGQPVDCQRWYMGGWAERTSYDPRGLGREGWGTLNGYTQEEVAAMPEFSRPDLLDYLGEVYNSVIAYLRAVPEDELFQAGSGFAGRFTRYQCIQMALMDNVRHLGEIIALKSMWERGGSPTR